MLIIFGFRIRFRTTGTTTFFCPRCGGDRQGDHRVARRWFTIFFIPIIPLNQVGELIECATCHTRYEPHVADQPTTASLSEVLGNAVRVLAAMVVRTGDPQDGAMRDAAVQLVRTVAADYDDATLTSDVMAVDPAFAQQYVGPLADGLQVAGKERLLTDLVRVALAAGTVTPDQRRVIDQAGRGLDLTPAHVTGIVSSVASERSPEPQPPRPEPPTEGAGPTA
ncbi:TerB family tellurite resistance protein [soil metagenome]